MSTWWDGRGRSIQSLNQAGLLGPVREPTTSPVPFCSMLDVHHDGSVATLTLDRQERRNALNTEQCANISRAVQSSVAQGARAIVLTGAGSSFCSGADFGEVYGEGYRDALYAMLHDVVEAPVPVI